MCCLPASAPRAPHEKNIKQTVIRLIALFFCLAYIAISLLGAAFLLSHANHEHDHDGPGGSCAACAQIAAAANLTKQLSTAMAVMELAFGCLSALVPLRRTARSQINFFTLVNQKVRLNN